MDGQEMNERNRSVPVPDPTTLTTEQLNRAIEQLQRELGQLEQLLQTRINGMEDHCQLRIDGLEEQLKGRISGLVEADKQKETLLREFLDMRLRMMADTRDQQFASMKELFQTVLGAMEAAVNKAESAMSRQLVSLEQVIDTKDSAREIQIREVEKRVDRDEGKGAGMWQSWGVAIAVIMMVIAIAGVVITATMAATP